MAFDIPLYKSISNPCSETLVWPEDFAAVLTAKKWQRVQQTYNAVAERD